MKNTPLIEVKIPQYWLVRVDDYHEFDYIQDSFKNIGLSVKYEEIDVEHPYLAVFWIGRKPIDVIKKLKEEG